jgi:polysaccharide biosynthesis protein PelA
MLLTFLLAGALLLTLWWFFRSRPMTWIVYYGNTVTQQDLQKVDLAILEPDNVIPSELSFKSKTEFIGYLSVGEVHNERYYWHDIQHKSFVIEENPDWPGAHRVDIRDQEWRDLLLNDVIPVIVEKGYRGLFLDTIDTAMYLEEKDPVRFQGSKVAMVRFIREIHKRYPELAIYPNNGFQFLKKYDDIIAGVVVEDLYTRAQFRATPDSQGKHTYEKTPIDATRWKEQMLSGFEKPVLVILYDTAADTELIRYGAKQCKRKGYLWYAATVALNTIGTTN